MMPFILLCAGLAFIFLEFYLPGLVMGAIGGFMVLTSVVVFADQSNSPTAIVLFGIGVGVSVVLLIKYTLRRIPRAKPQYSIYLESDQHGYRASKFDSTAIGKTGIVISDLKPGGYILIEDKKHQAISQSGYIAEGSTVSVIGGQEESLIVRQINVNKGKTL